MATCKQCNKKGLFLSVNKAGLCDECQEKELLELRSALLPEQKDVAALKNEICELSSQRAAIVQQISASNQTLSGLFNEINACKTQIIEMDEQILLQEFGFYKPKYPFTNSEEYKLRLDNIRQQQKEMIKNGIAVTGNMNWTVNNSASQGKKMVKDMQKLLLRAFNSECDEVINKVKYSNYDVSERRLGASCQAISKLGQIMKISITQNYYDLKLQELALSFEYQQMKQKEKEEQKELRAQLREEEKLAKEIEAKRRKLEKEETHYLNALAKINLQLSQNASDADLLEKQLELQCKLDDIQKSIKDVDYREANKKAGYVYIISNLGAFGENVYKIGMTRRLEPQDRIDELSDASVPFNFDVHAMLFADDAPALENALHKAFEDRKINIVNQRREFFRVTLEEIKAVVKKNYDKTAEFVDVAEAEQFRLSERLRIQ